MKFLPKVQFCTWEKASLGPGRKSQPLHPGEGPVLHPGEAQSMGKIFFDGLTLGRGL